MGASEAVLRVLWRTVRLPVEIFRLPFFFSLSLQNPPTLPRCLLPLYKERKAPDALWINDGSFGTCFACRNVSYHTNARLLAMPPSDRPTYPLQSDFVYSRVGKSSLSREERTALRQKLPPAPLSLAAQRAAAKRMEEKRARAAAKEEAVGAFGAQVVPKPAKPQQRTGKKVPKRTAQRLAVPKAAAATATRGVNVAVGAAAATEGGGGSGGTYAVGEGGTTVEDKVEAAAERLVHEAVEKRMLQSTWAREQFGHEAENVQSIWAQKKFGESASGARAAAAAAAAKAEALLQNGEAPIQRDAADAAQTELSVLAKAFTLSSAAGRAAALWRRSGTKAGGAEAGESTQGAQGQRQRSPWSAPAASPRIDLNNLSPMSASFRAVPPRSISPREHRSPGGGLKRKLSSPLSSPLSARMITPRQAMAHHNGLIPINSEAVASPNGSAMDSFFWPSSHHRQEDNPVQSGNSYGGCANGGGREAGYGGGGSGGGGGRGGGGASNGSIRDDHGRAAASPSSVMMGGSPFSVRDFGGRLDAELTPPGSSAGRCRTVDARCGANDGNNGSSSASASAATSFSSPWAVAARGSAGFDSAAGLRLPTAVAASSSRFSNESGPMSTVDAGRRGGGAERSTLAWNPCPPCGSTVDHRTRGGERERRGSEGGGGGGDGDRGGNGVGGGRPGEPGGGEDGGVQPLSRTCKRRKKEASNGGDGDGDMTELDGRQPSGPRPTSAP